MKTLVFLTLLTLSLLVSAVNAGLDTDTIANHVIAVYHFETTQETDGGLLYTEDSGPQNLPGALLGGCYSCEMVANRESAFR